ncbi:MAG: prepilin peptidase [Halobacteriales archaeon]
MLGTVPDLLRLLAVPALGWAAWRDVRTRRVPNAVWYPLGLLGVALLAWDAWGHLPPAGFEDRLFLLRVGVSLGFVAPLAVAFWWFGAFGGADAKAFLAVAVLFPTYPTYYLPWAALPAVVTSLGVFSMTVLSNTVVLGLLFPLALSARNLAAGELSPLMFLGRRLPVSELAGAHGKLFETREGIDRDGLDLDALRMYLRWRGTTLAAVRADPAAHRDPGSIDGTTAPGDGRVAGADVRGDPAPIPGSGADAPDGSRGRSDAGADGGAAAGGDGPDPGGSNHDPWGAERFLAELDGSAYGTTPEKLREGLELLAARDRVWISPGIPFIVPLFGGLVVGLTYGDLLFGLLAAVGAV